MARVKPFRAWRYDGAVVSDLAAVLAPPYDIISPDQQAALYEREPHNIVRLEFAKAEAGEGAARYAHIAAILRQWEREGVLRRDGEPAFYVHRHHFQLDGELRVRTGVFAAVGLEEYEKRIILPHESTLAKPKEDRLNLLRATQMNISPIFGIVPDADTAMRSLLAEFASGEPDAVAAGEDRHELWRITGEAAERLSQRLADREVVIADGHHRYETSLAYRDEMRARLAGETPAPRGVPSEASSEYTMMHLVSSTDEGLCILAAHRLLRLDHAPTEAELRQFVGARFEVAEYPRRPDGRTCLDALAEGEIGFACYLGGRWYLLKLREPLPAGMLHVEALHEWLVDPLVGGIEHREARLGFVISHLEAADRVDSGEFQMGFFLKSVCIEELEMRSREGGVMPQKSTYFYPKVPTGLVLKSASAEEEL